MAGEIEEEAPQQNPSTRLRHINKRALKNKALSVSFNEKDLQDYVTGFHKRKKKRRKEAQKQQEEVLRRKRIEQRKKRKLEKELVYGGAPPAAGASPNETDEYHEDDEVDPTASITGTTLYDNGDLQVIVRTSEISREEDDSPSEKILAAVPRSIGPDKKHNVPVSKTKSFKKVAKHKSKPKQLKKRDKKKAKNRNKDKDKKRR